MSPPDTTPSETPPQPLDCLQGGNTFAVLVVAYRTVEKLQKCLNSVREHLPGYPVHVWDNSGPEYEGVRHLAQSMPEINWYLGGRNIGFAAAVNKLAAHAAPADFLLLNPDAELVGPLTATRFTLYEGRTAAAGPIEEFTGKQQSDARPMHQPRPWDSARRRLTLLNAIGSTASCDRRFRGTPLSALYKAHPRSVDGYVTGACLAIRRDAWEAIGPFDEEFFLYGEEADWQRRAIAAGWRVALQEEMGYRHTASGTVSDDADAYLRSQDLLRSNSALSLEYLHGAIAADLYLAFTSVIDFLRAAVGRSTVRPTRVVADFVIPLDLRDDAVATERIRTANTLQSAGYRVALVALGRLGDLPAQVPTSIRLLRWPWWWPLSTTRPCTTVLVPGRRSRRDTGFVLVSRLFRIGKLSASKNLPASSEAGRA
jgi:GT2 family glycosyltransferase